MLVREHVNLILHSHCNPQELAVQRSCTEQVATLCVGDVVGDKSGLGANFYPICVKFLQGDRIEVVALFGIACIDQSDSLLRNYAYSVSRLFDYTV